MSLKSEIHELLGKCELAVHAHGDVAAHERGRIIDALHGVRGLLETSEDPAVHADPEPEAVSEPVAEPVKVEKPIVDEKSSE